MDNIIDFPEYRRKQTLKHRNCLSCRSIGTDNWLRMPQCTNVFSEYHGQIVTKNCECEYFIRKGKPDGNTVQM